MNQCTNEGKLGSQQQEQFSPSLVSLTCTEVQGAAVKIAESVKPELSAAQQAFFVAGFQECIKWLSATKVPATDNTPIEIVNALAAWSRKYPRGGIYSIASKMDDELIELEEKAKAWVTLQQALNK
jgi:hypothetical protein